MKGGSFTFADVHLLHDKCQKINPNCEVLYIDTPNWIKKKKKTPIKVIIHAFNMLQNAYIKSPRN